MRPPSSCRGPNTSRAAEGLPRIGLRPSGCMAWRGGVPRAVLGQPTTAATHWRARAQGGFVCLRWHDAVATSRAIYGPLAACLRALCTYALGMCRKSQVHAIEQSARYALEGREEDSDDGGRAAAKATPRRARGGLGVHGGGWTRGGTSPHRAKASCTKFAAGSGSLRIRGRGRSNSKTYIGFRGLTS